MKNTTIQYMYLHANKATGNAYLNVYHMSKAGKRTCRRYNDLMALPKSVKEYLTSSHKTVVTDNESVRILECK